MFCFLTHFIFVSLDYSNKCIIWKWYFPTLNWQSQDWEKQAKTKQTNKKNTAFHWGQQSTLESALKINKYIWNRFKQQTSTPV